MLQDIKRPINFRPILLCALSLFLGVIIFQYYPVFKAWTIVIPIVGVGLIALLFCALVKRENRQVVLNAAAICLVFVFVGMLSLGLRVHGLTKDNPQDGVYTVVGEVKKVSYKQGAWYFTLTDCEYDGARGSDLYVYAVTNEVELYDIVKLKGYAKGEGVIDGVKISNKILSGRPMSISEPYELEIIGRSDSLASRFKTRTDQIFYKALGEDGGILSALIRGDVSKMKEGVDLFRLAGIAHIFAVSGMHIGLIYAALSFMFSKIKIKRGIKVAVISLALVFYSYLCGLSSSSLRAVIMCTCLMLSKLLGEKHDGVNALSEAAIIVVLINPLDMFSAGFKLSFLVCLSIIILAPPIKSVLKFMPEAFSSSISVLCASQLAAIPLSVIYFSGVPLISFVANFLLLPIVSLLYYFVAIATLLCLVLPINELIALFIPKILIVGIKGITECIVMIPLIVDYMTKPIMAVYYFLLFCISDVVNLPKKVKFSCGVVFLALVLFVVAHSFFG